MGTLSIKLACEWVTFFKYKILKHIQIWENMLPKGVILLTYKMVIMKLII